ncbi:hypothetical protein [Synechococcus sp. KORDI-52]|uniref:hypothetical protein n=1 Tax=Synechococcus sp. KORDI-52 TaxID=585425 RepID=UPI003527C709
MLSLPVRAPMLTVLFLVALVLGHHWQLVQPSFTSLYGVSAAWFWCLVVLQAQVVVIFCTMPDLLLRQVSLLMASSRVMTLVVTLLVVITGGLYLMKLNVFTDVLILASALLLARLDLIRIGVLPASGICLLWMSVVVIGGIATATLLPQPTLSLVAEGLRLT